MTKERKTLELKGSRLMEIRSGFMALKDKRLPNGDTEALVTSMYQLIRSAVDAYNETIESIHRDLRLAEAMEEIDEKEAELRRCQDRLDALNNHVYVVTAPRTRLSRQHLPKSYKTRDGSGDMNPAGNAAIMMALGEEFFDMPSEPAAEESHDDDHEGEG